MGFLTRSAIQQFCKDAERISVKGYKLSKTKTIYHPVVAPDGESPEDTLPGVGKIMTVVDEIDGTNSFYMLSVVKNPDNDQYEFSHECRSPFLTGSMVKSQAKALCKVAAKKVGLPESTMFKHYGKYKPDKSCDFHLAGHDCNHKKFVFNHFNVDQINTMLDELIQEYEDLIHRVGAAFDNALNRQILRFTKDKRTKPVLLEGDRGSGKTYGLRALEHSLEAKYPGKVKYIEIPGHEGMTTTDMLGYVRPVVVGDNTKKTTMLNRLKAMTESLDEVAMGKVSSEISKLREDISNMNMSEQQFMFVDGPLTRSIRLASQGYKVICNIDEIFRLQTREQNVFMSLLSPTPQNTYKLETGNVIDIIDGISQTEVLEAPCENLFFGATTNVGMDYTGVDEGDPALLSRFVIQRMDNTVANMKKILGIVIDEAGYSKDLLEKIVKLHTKVCAIIKTGLYNRMRPMSIRSLVDSVRFADNENDVVNTIKEHIPNWIERDVDGNLIQEQKEALLTAIDDIFS